MVTVNETMVREILDRLTRLEERQEHMATKEDLGRLEARVDSIENRMATKEDLAHLETRLIKWFVGSMLAAVAVATALATLIERIT